MDAPITISDRSKPARQSDHLTIGGLIFPRLDQIDMSGPFEVLSIPNSTIRPKNYAAITRKAGGSGIQLRVACRKRDKGRQSGHRGQ